VKGYLYPGESGAHPQRKRAVAADYPLLTGEEKKSLLAKIRINWIKIYHADGIAGVSNEYLSSKAKELQFIAAVKQCVPLKRLCFAWLRRHYYIQIQLIKTTNHSHREIRDKIR